MCSPPGILVEIRKRAHYEKPSVRRKKKSAAARKEGINRAVCLFFGPR